MTTLPTQGMMMQGEDPSMAGARRSISPDPQKKKRKLDPVRGFDLKESASLDKK
jgi:hypothetical protein